MDVLGAIGSLLGILATFAPTIVERLAAKDAQKKDFFKAATDAVSDASELVKLGEDIQKENAASDEEYKKRGL
jgi:hypothetical protein